VTRVGVNEPKVVLQDAAGGLTMADAGKRAILDVVSLVATRSQISSEEFAHLHSIARDLDLRQAAIEWECLNLYLSSDTVSDHSCYTSIEIS
jgi:hypothetical protein